MIKKNLLSKIMVLLCVAGNSNVWAADVETTYTFKSKSWGATCEDVAANWTSGKDGGGYNANQGVQITSSASGANATSPVSFDNVKKITVEYSTNNKAGDGTIEVKVGDGDAQSFTVTSPSSGGTTLKTTNFTFDPEESGEVTLTVTCTANSIYINSITIVNEASGPIDPLVKMDVTAIGVGATAAISFPADLTTISFESDDTDVATVSAAGVVTGVAAGTAKITATWTAVTGTYNAGSEEFTVTVMNPTVYEKVTSKTQLVPGNEYILVATGYNLAMGADNEKKRSTVGVTITEDKISILNEAVAVLTLGGSLDDWTFLASDNSLYLALTKSSNELHTSDDATAAASKWTVTDDFMLESNAQSGRIIKYNASQPRFACYASGQQDAVLFVKQGSPTSVPVTITDAEYATYCPPVNVDFSTTGITAYTAQPNTTTVTLTEIASGKVPANTPVVLYKASADGSAINVPVAESAEAVTGNDLMVSDGTTAVGDNVYVLSKNATLGVGFYHWTSASSLSAGKVYLNVAAPAREFMGFDSETTGIAETKTVSSDNNTAYDLSGRRVDNPAKGLYIVNGKKIVIK